MATNEQPGQSGSAPVGDPCPLCGTAPTSIAGLDTQQVARDFFAQHRCTPRVRTRARS